MGRSFHQLHVYAPKPRIRERVVKAVRAYAKRAGFELVCSTRNADRVIRIGGAAPWLSISDDGYEISAIASAVAAAVREPMLETYCEASAIVSIGMIAGGRRVGGWGGEHGRTPPKRHVEAILAKGTPAELTQAWESGAQQVFPETAFANVAPLLGMKVDRILEEAVLRGTTLALRRVRNAWKPEYSQAPPALDASWSGNQSWGEAHLMFDGNTDEVSVSLHSIGGRSRGLAVRFAGDALYTGLVEIVSVSSPAFTLVRDGEVWSDRTAKIHPALTNEADVFALGQREMSRMLDLQYESRWSLQVQLRACKEGDGTLEVTVETDGTESSDELPIHVQWKPWRPSTTLEHVQDGELFGLHRSEHATAHIALRGSLADLWAWARPHLEAWAGHTRERFVVVSRADDVVLRVDRDDDEAAGLPWDQVAAHIPTDARTVFDVRGSSYRFGTTAYAPWRLHADDMLAVQLVLDCENEDDSCDGNMAKLVAICDDAMRSGLAYSAHAAHQEKRAGDETSWEAITVRDTTPTKLVAWHEQRIRGLHKRMWISNQHLARIDRSVLERFGEVTELGAGVRVLIPLDTPRAEMEPLVTLLAPILPSNTAAESFERERAEKSRRDERSASAPAAVPV